MPKPNIYSQVLNLSQIDVYRNDIGNLDNYFTLDGLPTNLSYGKHAFSIGYNNPIGLPHLKNNSKEEILKLHTEIISEQEGTAVGQ